jgi:hypothetical protein
VREGRREEGEADEGSGLVGGIGDRGWWEGSGSGVDGWDRRLRSQNGRMDG